MEGSKTDFTYDTIMTRKILNKEEVNFESIWKQKPLKL